jgi:iron complex outermembrane receptor protein
MSTLRSRTKTRFCNAAIAALCTCVLLGTTLAAPPAEARSVTYNLDIPSQSLNDALQALALTSQHKLLYSSELVDGKKSPALKGEFTTEQAVTVLLSETDLTYEVTSDGVVLIRAAGGQSAPISDTSGAGAATPSVQPPTPTDGDRKALEGKKGFLDRFRLAQVDQGTPASSTTVTNTSQNASKSSGNPAQLEEVIVTAEKSSERLLDVPMSLTALNGEQLVRSGSYRFEDYVGNVPGLTLIDNGGLGSQLVIRGMTTGVQSVNSSVATYIDETPYAAEGPFVNSTLAAPNLDTFDMQRIEVLRGPQGTLYGSNALGGLLKYVTNAPDPSGFAAKVETGVSSMYNGGAGFDMHAMVNVPLGDNTALRVVGYDNYYPGFIDDPSRGLNDINGTRVAGGRASLLYEPTANFSIRFSALYQDRWWDDWGDEDVSPSTFKPLYGNLIQENLISQPGFTKTQIYNTTMNWDAGFAKLLSSTSYSKFHTDATVDFSKTLGPLVSSIFGAPYGFAYQNDTDLHTFTQEIRLSSSDNERLQWKVGGFFTDESGFNFEPFFPIDVTTKTVLFNFPTNLGISTFPVRYREYAGFASIDYHVTPTFDVDLGGRYSENNQTFHETTSGVFAGAFNFGQSSSQGVFTYSGDARWHVTPTNMLYARIAEGFVPGGPNNVVPGGNLLPSYSSSTTVNYEVGIKSSLLDDHLTIEVSAFAIDWRDIQLQATIGGLGTTVNGGAAHSGGLEWNFAYVPVSGLTVGFNGAYTDAYLTQPTPASVNGQVGDRLPAVPLWESSVSANYERPLFGDYSGFAGMNWRFMGSRYADFSASGPRQEMPSFQIVDLRAGLETKRWSFALYVKNVGNKIAINYVQPETLSGGSGPQSATVYTPRIIGATLAANF